MKIHKRDEGGLVYYYTNCSRCKDKDGKPTEIRAHVKGQVKHNFGLHQLTCKVKK